MAVCITGQIRQLEHTHRIISKGLEFILPGAHLIAIVPSSDVRKTQNTLNTTSVFVQDRCTQKVSPKYACSGLFRPHCRENFVQTLCDAQSCIRRVQEEEKKRGYEFKTIARVRPDTLFETTLRVPSILPNEIHVPAMMSSSCYNDQFVIGGRRAMVPYLNRLNDMSLIQNAKSHRVISECFLKTVLWKHGITVVTHPEWMYCLLSYRQYKLTAHKRSSCIYRWKTRMSPCYSFQCATECLCVSDDSSNSTVSDQLFLHRNLFNLSAVKW